MNRWHGFIILVVAVQVQVAFSVFLFTFSHLFLLTPYCLAWCSSSTTSTTRSSSNCRVNSRLITNDNNKWKNTKVIQSRFSYVIPSSRSSTIRKATPKAATTTTSSKQDINYTDNYKNDRKIYDYCNTDDIINNGIQILIPEPRKGSKAYPQQTPHSGCHFVPSHPSSYIDNNNHNNNQRSRKNNNFFSFFRKQRRHHQKRVTEGWYYRLTIPEKNVSFAFIISIEDPSLYPPLSPVRLACIQVIGPHDEYLVQGDQDTTLFWAWKYQQGLGCAFKYKQQFHEDEIEIFKQQTALTKEEWHRRVESGFQILPTSFIGKIRGHDGTSKGGILRDENNANAFEFGCDFDFTISPICGWGGSLEHEQKSTAGWLASFPIFEPHWQITIADARASGSVTWKNTTYQFINASMYAEKNWGAALPQKWYWTQCNSFRGYEQQQLCVVAGGGVRQVPFGKVETLGMVSVHYNGKFYEAVPWMGGMEWEVDTWGYWKLRGNNTFCKDNPFEVEVIYKIDDPVRSPGLVFRAPTPDEGMVRFCRDTFEAECMLTLWELQWDNDQSQYIRKPGKPLIDAATSNQGGAEVGGGPWWDTWKGEARLKKPIKALLLFPHRLNKLKQRIVNKSSR